MENNEIKPVNVKKGWWGNKSSRQKVSFIITIIILLISIYGIISLLFARDLYGDALADKLYGSSDVPNGFVALWNVLVNAGESILSSLIVVAVTIVGTISLNFLIHLFTMNGSKKTKTTASIIRSVIKYAAILVAAAILLSIWGVNVTGIVASLGILTLIIGLGCQSLINDVVSGLFIVFDDYFSVGDMVIIDGFRGYVEEIGLRAVKINDSCGNIKSINNSSILTVVNLSRQPNYISITMEASYNEDVERLEAVFMRELPKIKNKIPEIVDGPFYKGIDGFSDRGIVFNFAFFVKAENRFQATRDFKREIYQMFVKNNIIVPYLQFSVNPPDPKDRPKASVEDKNIIKKPVKTNKNYNNKKSRFRQKIAKAYSDTVEEVKKEL